MTFETIYTDGDIDTNPTANPHINDLIDVRYSRRQTLMGGMSATAAAVFGGMLLTGCDDDNDGGSDPVTVTATAGGSSTAAPVSVATRPARSTASAGRRRQARP
jgi:secreted PhoX family phosphatase